VNADVSGDQNSPAISSTGPNASVALPSSAAVAPVIA
jgi:hypothetical protein